MANFDVDEDVRSRTLRYLDDAWGVEKSLVSSLDSMAKEMQDKNQQVSQMFAQHRDETHQQEENLEARIRAMGDEPSGGTGFFGGLMAKFGEMMHRPHDDYDQVTQNLIKAYAIENFEMGMYQSLLSYASGVGDADTASLAQTHLQQERATAERLWAMIQPAAMAPAQAQAGTANRPATTYRDTDVAA